MIEFGAEFWWEHFKRMFVAVKGTNLNIGKQYVEMIAKHKSMSDIDDKIIKGIAEGMALIVSTHVVDGFVKEAVRKKTEWYVS